MFEGEIVNSFDNTSLNPPPIESLFYNTTAKEQKRRCLIVYDVDQKAQSHVIS